MRRACVGIVGFLLAYSGSYGQNPFLTSVAMSDDARGIIVNPAGLGISRGPNTLFLSSHSEDELTSYSFLLQTGGVGFGYNRRQQFPEYNKFILALGTPMARGLSLGFRFTRTYWPEETHNSVDVGILWRPARILSVGAVSNNLNRPGGMERDYTVGLAFRPFTDRVTVFIDGNLEENKDFEDATYLYGGEVEVVDGILLHGSVDDEGRVRAGFVVNFPFFGTGYESAFDESGEFTSGSVGMALSGDVRRTVFKQRHGFAEMELSGSIVDEKAGGLLATLFDGEGKTTKEIIDFIEKARKDESVDGIVLRLAGVGGGFAKIQEIRDKLSEFRKAGKKVVCYMESGGDGEYYLASVADVIVLNPGGYLDLNGLRAEALFLKGTLEKLGIKADLERIGEYKSASELLTRDSMSDPYREVLNSILDDVYSHITGEMARGRGMKTETLIDKVDGGPYTPQGAYEAGLVDRLAYEDEIEGIARDLNGGRYSEMKEARFARREYWEYRWGSRPKLALIYACGSIVSGESGYNPFLLGKYMGSATIARAIKEAREDKSIKAIVFRVDSPGGTGLASDVIWREVRLARKEKPFIVSMSDVAGSGGYLISCAADVIVAEPGTITGSIGVISGKFDMHGLYDKLGMNKEIITRGEHAAIYSDYQEFTPEEREIVRAQLEEFYTDFVGKVADGRKMESEQVDSIGRGRVWTGNQASRNGLVDVLGGLDTALTIAKRKAGISEAEEVELVVLPRRWRFFSGMHSSFLNLESGLRLEFPLRNSEALLMMPYELEIE